MKKISLFWSVAFLTVGYFTSCESYGPKDDNFIPVKSISLNTDYLIISDGDECTLTANVLPANATDKTVIWKSSNTNVASVENGTVKALSNGHTVIKAQAGENTATCSVVVKTIPDGGTIINGIVWAKTNVGATGTFVSYPNEYGGYYQWNRNDASHYLSQNDYYYGSNHFPYANYWLPNNDPSPSGWRIPTINELSTLLDENNVRCEWTEQNGVYGSKFIDIHTKKIIFLPAGGQLNSTGNKTGVGIQGNYWSSTSVEADSWYAYRLIFDSNQVYCNYNTKHVGKSIRSVAQ